MRSLLCSFATDSSTALVGIWPLGMAALAPVVASLSRTTGKEFSTLPGLLLEALMLLEPRLSESLVAGISPTLAAPKERDSFSAATLVAASSDAAVVVLVPLCDSDFSDCCWSFGGFS